MARLPLFALVLLPVLALAPVKASADEATKDQEIATLQAQVTALKARISELEANLKHATRALELTQRTIAELREAGLGAPAPTSGGMNQGQETSREQMKYLVSLFRSYKPKDGAPQWPALDGKNF